MLDPLLLSSATALAHKIRQREVSSREVVERHIARIERVNPTINAVVQNRFATARAEADAADARVRDAAANEVLPPLHGVPCTIKECITLTGMPHTGGLVSRKGRLATVDATSVTRLRAAGAIPLGVTNVSELMMWYETFNRLYGRTNNPYDPRRMVGGSSGGEGAIVGAGGVPFGLGADIGGSIRMPAFFNGVFGHKPTGGLVPSTGHWPLGENAAMRYLTLGPLARRADDLHPLLQILAGPDGTDAGCGTFTLRHPREARPLFDERRLVVSVVEGNGTIRVSRDLLDAQKRAADALAAAGATVRTIRIDKLRQSFDIWSTMLTDATDTRFTVHLGGGRPINAVVELAKMAVGRSTHTLPAVLLAAFEKLPWQTRARTDRFLAMGRELRAEVVELLGDEGVLLYPPFSRVAPRHMGPLLTPFHFVFTAIFNVLELPVTQVPLGLDGAGLPLGVQVVGGPGNDHLTIAVALELEQRLGGWVPPPTL